jgi:hypothetical protein
VRRAARSDTVRNGLHPTPTREAPAAAEDEEYDEDYDDGRGAHGPLLVPRTNSVTAGGPVDAITLPWSAEGSHGVDYSIDGAAAGSLLAHWTFSSTFSPLPIR